MEKFKGLSKDKISKLPKTPGVYIFKKGREFLYIGKAVNLRDRVKQHEELLDLVKQLAYVETESETEALLLEAKLIKKYQPKHNVNWKDDKNYFYVGITEEPFPRIFITHQLKTKNYQLKTNYIGPFVNGRELKRALKNLRKVYPYRTCKNIPKKPCLWYHLKQCPAPCLFFGKHIEAYDISDIQGKEAAGSMVTFISGKPDKNFYRRFKIKSVAGPNDVAMIGEVLSRRLKHTGWPYPDIILIDGGKAQLNAAIKSIKKLDIGKLDIGCPTKGHPMSNFPMSNFRIMALAKKENKLFITGQKNPVSLKSFPEEFANSILRARDEAHRFARAYHHYLRERRLLF